MVLLRPGYEKDYERSPSVFTVGCRRHQRSRTAPQRRVQHHARRADEVPHYARRGEPAVPVAHVTTVADGIPAADKATLHTRRQRLEALVRDSGGRTGLRATPDGISDVTLVNGISQLARIDELDREQLLETPNPLARADALIALLEKMIAERPAP